MACLYSGGVQGEPGGLQAAWGAQGLRCWLGGAASLCERQQASGQTEFPLLTQLCNLPLENSPDRLCKVGLARCLARRQALLQLILS